MDDKLEYRRQRERLKMMAPAAERSKVSADDMINNLLQKSDTFKKVSDDLPPWAQCGSPTVCPYYESVWNIVRVSEKMVDTPRISQLLLTSGLHPDVLGFIWNLANKAVPGQLTKQELFIVLALVGLAQLGRAFNSLSVLKLVTSAPIPKLAVSLPHVPVQPYLQNQQFSNPNASLTVSHSLQLPTNPSTPIVSPHLDDEFQDFQSSPMPTVSNRTMPDPRAFNSIRPNVPPVVTKSSLDEITASLPPASTQPLVPSLLADMTFKNSSIIDQSSQDAGEAQLFSSFTSQLLNPPAHSLTSLDLTPPLSSTNSVFPDVELERTEVPEDEFTEFQSVSVGHPQELPSSTSDLPTTRSSFNISPISVDKFSEFQAVSVDNFSDFQAAVIQPPKISLPKLPSSIMVSPESERKLRNLAQPESLSSLPESKISSRNQVSSMPSIAVLSGSRGVGNRLANHSLSAKQEKKHHKHFKIKPIMTAPTSALPESLFPKCTSKSNSSFLLKETKIPSSDLIDELEPNQLVLPELTRRIEIPSVGTFQETTLPVDIKPSTPEIVSDPKLTNLTTTVEDRYSALRGLELTNSDVDVGPANEDFGDYLSAELESEKTVEAWTVWNSSIAEGGIDSMSERGTTKNLEPPQIEESSASFDLLGGSFEIDKEITSSTPDLVVADGFSPLQVSHRIEDLNHEDDDFGDFVTPTLEEKTLAPTKLLPAEDSSSIKSREDSTPSLDLGLTRHGSWSSLEFNGQSVSRKGSVPSLDLKLDTSSQDVAGRSHECCLRLLKDAVLIFDNVSDKTVLQEIFMTIEARNYMKYLQVVYYIARRISLSGGGSRSSQESIDALWQKLQLLAADFSVLLMDYEEVDGAGERCAVCKGPTSTSDLEQNGVWYHISCANLWVNCIDTSLPCH